MAATDFIVAIELGSSRITGIAGEKCADGSIQVLALASEKSSDFIRKGVIYNLDKTAKSLTSIIKKLESTLKASIGKVYVGIGGQSLRTIRNTEIRHLEEETKISQELIDSIMDSNREVPIIDQEILEVAPQEYKVGYKEVIDPVGVPSDHIEGRFLNIIARNRVKQNIDKCFIQAGVEIADYIIAPLAMTDAVLTGNEKRSGCMLIDFGADTTTVSVYKNNILRHLAVIPLGGYNITKDICSQQMEEDEAEELKIKYGSAYTEKTDSGESTTYALDGKCSIAANMLEDIVEARVNEILANVWNQVILSGYEDKLLAGAILTGGAANLKNMEAAFTNRTKVEKVRIARESQISVRGNVELKRDGTQNTIIALLDRGKENCCQLEKPKPPVQAPPFTSEQTQAGEAPAETPAEKRKREQEAAAKAAKEAAEEKKQRKADCEELIAAALKLKEEKKYKSALSQLSMAKALDVAEKADQIQALEKECKKLKEENSPVSKIINMFGKILDED